MPVSHVIALDQGTTSTRAIVFDHAGRIIETAQREHAQIFPRAGRVEHDPLEIWTNAEWVLSRVVDRASTAKVVAVGVTNQRETSIVWDRRTGLPVHNALVWQDTRTQQRIDRLVAAHGVRGFAETTGLPLATYFSASKVAWILDNVEGAREAAEGGHLLFGTPDTWLVWNLTGGVHGGIHVTDVTNASRTMLMDLRTLDWSDELLELWRIPRRMLPEIRSSSEVYGHVQLPGALSGVPIAGILGDQQAATFGQAAFGAGESKNTYGTGNFVLVGTGTDIVQSKAGLITTVAYQCAGEPAHYALEGSIAVTGSLVQWLRDNLGIIERSEDVETLADTVDDNGGAYFVPAFSGLFAPYWRPDARGTLVGLTRYVTKAHIARAALEATAFQTRDVIEAVVSDAGRDLAELRVDGGMTRNNALMQFQADILGIPVVRPKVIETTALGAAYAAGLAVGVWGSRDELRAHWQEDVRFEPRMPADERARRFRLWKKAVSKSIDWVDDDARALAGTLE
ncbi:glycerol kinase GlpK [Microbacterium sp. No. 7]|uniref:glycerol kinase GlpK n=1 Tax=Microbacterium sp. No. 7 TaxID=1714373 RepID=UPI0012E14D3E|nr:glycerol kinase GlpK [Microbacterium sp. No. 7]